MNMFENRTFAAVSFIAAGVALAIIGWQVLPETVVVQLTFGGEAANTMPKLLALALPLVLTTLGAVLYAKKEQKGLPVALVGLAAYVFTFIVNR